MILDLQYCKIHLDIDTNSDNNVQDNEVTVQPHLTIEKWVVIAAAESPSIASSNLKDSHIDLSIIKRINIDTEKEIWLVPLSSLTGPCFVVLNRNYCDRVSDKDICVTDNTHQKPEIIDCQSSKFIIKIPNNI